ncbi:hypothetical protein GCM10007860_22440 [Chitiniphilus shinanonensis]|uniref:Uncharacterized protein n=1 Tax=Chitiniphilus shinanonensis TaxID=553088 RepID=A0ABQ6BZF6_9NEIS|nr:hypothetical protein [Chitiniphilus shinanonensis]GLS05094.1 hypothetical protein GCM10007860_22440 [Chitiniphilus shinanonensis]
MDTARLIEFLGHSSNHPALDQFLTAHGVTRRPETDGATEDMASDDGTLVLTFQSRLTFDKESLLPRKSDGAYILAGVTFRRAFAHPLPHGLSLERDRAAIDKLLGPARRERVRLPSATYYFDGLVIVVNRNRARPDDASIGFWAPDIYDRDTLGLL